MSELKSTTSNQPGLLEKSLRAIQVALAAILALIIFTGGGRIGVVDFKSIGAWAAPLLFIGLYFIYQKKPAFPHVSVQEKWLKPTPWVFAFFGVIAIVGLLKILTFNVNIFDAGFLFQSITQGFNTPILKCDICTRDSYLGEHQSLSLLLLTPLAALFNSPLFFPITLALLGLSTHLLIQRHFRSKLGSQELFFLFFALISIRGLRQGFTTDFREDALGAFFFTGSIFFAVREKWVAGGCLFLLAALSKETAIILLPLAILSLEWAKKDVFSKKNRLFRYSIETAACAALFIFTFYYMTPKWAALDAAPGNFAIRLSYLGSTPLEIFETILFSPFSSLGKIAKDIFSGENLRYAVFSIGPFFPFMIRAWNPFYIPGVVLLAGNLASTAGVQKMMQFHYELLALPFFGFGLGYSLVRLKKNGKISPNFLIASALTFLCVSGTWPMTHVRNLLVNQDRIPSYFWIREEIAKLADQTLLADSTIYPSIATHSNLRPLLEEKYNPDSQAYVGSQKLKDASWSFIRGKNSDNKLSPQWELQSCSPNEIVCLYRHRLTPEKDQ